MGHFTLIANPGLWNDRPERRAGNSPHRETSDLWIRYASKEEMRGPGFMQREHQSVWWPAFHVLLSLPSIIVQFMRLVSPVRTGGILMTRIPPGCQVYPHDDRGSWHSEYYTTKVWLVLRGNDRCVNTVEDEEMVWKQGEAWSHDNLITHSVRNDGDSERIVLIMCFRRDE